MSNCCGEDYHYADCPIRTGKSDWDANDYSEDILDRWEAEDYPDYSESVDPENCQHGDENSEVINGETFMRCIWCETLVSKVTDCDNEDCISGVVLTDKPSLIPGKFVREDCPNGCTFGSFYETV